MPIRRWGSAELPRTCLDAMIDLCTGANPLETGGILAGTIRNERTARVVRASDPPRDSTQGPTTFHRGTEGVDEWLREARDSMGLLYLGEWHYHPSASPQLGAQDRAEMNEIASNEDYGRPNPILFIIGGDPPDDYAVRAYLFHRDRPHEELARVQSSDQPADDIDAQQSTIDLPRTTAGDHS
jgi:proteasome lid subunit RPN8/RPN11